MKRILLFLPVVLTFFCGAQEASEKPNYGISFSGFVKNDFFYDTRESHSIREGHFLLYPKEKSYDAEKNDINAIPSFNFLSIQTRLTGKISAPDAFGAKTSGVIEADFFGNENAAFVDVNGFRLRHAFVKLNWKKTELLAGQFWHPFFIPGCFSGVISFNTGAPMQPFSRNPQIRVQQKMGKIALAGIASAQRDFTSPMGSASQRWSSIPNISTVVSYETAKEGSSFLSGFALDYKALQPLLTTQKETNTYQTNEKVNGISATAFLAWKNPKFSYKLQAIYGQNLFNLTMLGGYAVHEITDPSKNRVSYTTLNSLTAWTEFQTEGKRVQFALWAGYSLNLGSDQTILYYSDQVEGSNATVRGANIKSLLRMSPRIVFIQGKVNIAAEVEYTNAAFATINESGALNRNEYGVITDWENVANTRFLLSLIYHF
ncbi:MAG TPA: hypothetical protein PLK12_01905 [Prolixibacteraceae bacterium]|nr:hypothetical protein [Prolixibacteraceae bacterium]